MLLGKTEIVKNNQNPEFAKSFEFDYYFEREQILKVEVFDDDGSSGDFVGYFEASVGKIMTTMSCKLTGELLKDGKAQNRGSRHAASRNSLQEQRESLLQHVGFRAFAGWLLQF